MGFPALYIGRFQPFHLGHLDAIRQILTYESHIIIAIGSAQESNTELNPLSLELRKKIIRKSLKEGQIQKEKYTILPLNDINNSAKWCDYVDETLPSYGTVYTGSPATKELYEKQNKHPVILLTMNLPITSTEIRRRMQSGENWKNLVPYACYFQLQKKKSTGQ